MVSDTEPTFDSILDLCANRRRRIVLGVLSAEQRAVTLTELARTIVKNTHNTSPTETPDDVLTEIRGSLHHNHLSKLTSEGLITYDSDSKRVEATEQLGQAQPILSMILDADPELEVPVDLACRTQLI